MKYVAKHSPTAKPTTLPLVPKACTLSKGYPYQVTSRLNPINFKDITVQNTARFNDGRPNTKVRFLVNCSMEHSPFISQHFKCLFHCHSCFSQPIFIRTFKKTLFGGGGGGGGIALAHVLRRRTARHPQAQKARKLLSASLAEIWDLENSVYCSVAIFQMSSV
jgi:hypothetical protein